MKERDNRTRVKEREEGREREKGREREREGEREKERVGNEFKDVKNVQCMKQS